MKIDLKQLPVGNPVSIVESESPEGWDLDLPGVHIFGGSPIEIKALVTRFQDALDIKITLSANCLIQCSRCLEEKESVLRKAIRLDYHISEQDTIVDITEDIRQELMLEYPLQPLCASDCKGLCMKCGRNLNKENCKCVSV